MHPVVSLAGAFHREAVDDLSEQQLAPFGAGSLFEAFLLAFLVASLCTPARGPQKVDARRIRRLASTSNRKGLAWFYDNCQLVGVWPVDRRTTVRKGECLFGEDAVMARDWYRGRSR